MSSFDCVDVTLAPASNFLSMKCSNKMPWTQHFTTSEWSLHCDGLYNTTMHCTALHCTALRCTAKRCPTLHCTTIHYNALHYTTLRCISLLPVLHYNKLYYKRRSKTCTVLHYTDQPCTALHYTALHCTALHWSEVTVLDFTTFEW